MKEITMKNTKQAKRQIVYGLTFLFILLSIAVLPSCKKNDGGGSVSDNRIVGTWTCSNHWYGGSDTYVFKSNGKYQWSGPYSRYESGDYSFNGTILTTSETSGTTRVYTIVALTNSYFVMMDMDGDSYTYYKQ